MSKKAYLFVLIGILLLAAVAASYGRMKGAGALAEERWKDAEALYSERVLLVSSFSDLVRARLSGELEALSSLDGALARYESAGSSSERAAAAAETESAYADILFALEGLPNLLSGRDIAEARSAIDRTSPDLIASFRNYNDAVRVYNMRVTGFPGSLIASLFGYEPKAYFQSADSL